MTKPKTASQKAFVVLMSFIIQIIYFYIVLINFPSDASSIETNKSPYINFSQQSSETLTFIGSFLAGLGDSGLNTQVIEDEEIL